MNRLYHSTFKKDEAVTIYALFPVDMKVIWRGVDCTGKTCDVVMSKSKVINVEFK